MARKQGATRDGDPLTATRRRADYSPAERVFSATLQRRLEDLLEGKCNNLELLRRYPGEPGRLGIIAMPRDVQRGELRSAVVERLTWEAIDFVRVDGVAGPVAQAVDEQGNVLESRIFPTKYPHVVIVRVDRFSPEGDGESPVEITWAMRRVQNQRVQTRINRVLDAVNVGFSVLGLLR